MGVPFASAFCVAEVAVLVAAASSAGCGVELADVGTDSLEGNMATSDVFGSSESDPVEPDSRVGDWLGAIVSACVGIRDSAVVDEKAIAVPGTTPAPVG